MGLDDALGLIGGVFGAVTLLLVLLTRLEFTLTATPKPPGVGESGIRTADVVDRRPDATG